MNLRIPKSTKQLAEVAACVWQRSLVQIDVVLLIRPARTLWWVTTTLLALVTNLRICFPSVQEAPFLLQSSPHIPQSDLGPIPAACLLKDSSQVIVDHFLWRINGCCDFAVRASL